MSVIFELATLANLTAVVPEDIAGNKHPMKGAIYFGPIILNNETQINNFLFGIEIDRHFREAGWTLVGKNGAAGNLDFSLLAPPSTKQHVDPRTGGPVWEEGGDTPLFMMHFLSDDSGDDIQVYNPFLNDPPPLPSEWEQPSGSASVWVEMGAERSGTMIRIAGAIGGRAYTPGTNGHTTYGVTFPVDDYGPAANLRHFGASGFFAIAGSFQGAGKTYESIDVDGVKVRMHFTMGGYGLGEHLTISVAVVKFSPETAAYESVGPIKIYPMMQQPDYFFFIDPYSFYMKSLDGVFHGDLAQLSNLFVAIPDPVPAIPEHDSGVDMPTVVVVSDDNWNLLISKTGTWYWDDTIIEGSADAFDESGRCFMTLHQGGGLRLGNIGNGDVLDPVRVALSSDSDEVTFKCSGPMKYVGNLRNCLLLHQNLTPPLSKYELDAPNPIPVGEQLLPKTYYSLFHQAGTEAFTMAGSAGTVLIAPVNYSVIEAINKQYTGAGGPLAIMCAGEQNLWCPTRASCLLTPSEVVFLANGGLGHSFTWTVVGAPAWVEIRPDPSGAGILVLYICKAQSLGTWAIQIGVHDTLGNSAVLQYKLVIGSSTYLIHQPIEGLTATIGVPMYVEGGTDSNFEWTFTDPPNWLRCDKLTGTVYGTPLFGGSYDFAADIKDLRDDTVITHNWTITVDF